MHSATGEICGLTVSVLELKVPPPVVGVLTAILMWGIARVTPGLDFSSIALRTTGQVLMAIGILLDIAAAISFRTHRTTINPLHPELASAVVRSGVFRFSRNPMYLGLAVILTGWGIVLANPLSLLFVPLFVWYLTRFQIIPEERALAEKFGTDYARYRESVRRWI